MDLPLIFLLIQYGADVNVRDQGGRTPFLNMASLNSRQYDDFMEFLEWWPTQLQLKAEELFNNGLSNNGYESHIDRCSDSLNSTNSLCY